MKESTLQAAILEYLHYRGIFCWRNNTTGVYDPIRKIFRRNKAVLKGVSDILGLLPPKGKFLAIEVKTKTGRVSKEQKLFLEKVDYNGGLGFVAKDLNMVKERLDNYFQNLV